MLLNSGSDSEAEGVGGEDGDRNGEEEDWIGLE
jgi:hypothetical protein